MNTWNRLIFVSKCVQEHRQTEKHIRVCVCVCVCVCVHRIYTDTEAQTHLKTLKSRGLKKSRASELGARAALGVLSKKPPAFLECVSVRSRFVGGVGGSEVKSGASSDGDELCEFPSSEMSATEFVSLPIRQYISRSLQAKQTCDTASPLLFPPRHTQQLPPTTSPAPPPSPPPSAPPQCMSP